MTEEQNGRTGESMETEVVVKPKRRQNTALFYAECSQGNADRARLKL